MEKHILGATVHRQKRPRMSDMSLGFPCKGNMGPWGKVHGSQKHPQQANIRQSCSIYVHLWVLFSFENHAAEESCQETSEEIRECGTADTCSSSVLTL